MVMGYFSFTITYRLATDNVLTTYVLIKVSRGDREIAQEGIAHIIIPLVVTALDCRFNYDLILKKLYLTILCPSPARPPFKFIKQDPLVRITRGTSQVYTLMRARRIKRFV